MFITPLGVLYQYVIPSDSLAPKMADVAWLWGGTTKESNPMASYLRTTTKESKPMAPNIMEK